MADNMGHIVKCEESKTHIMNTKYSEKSQVRSVLLPMLCGIKNNILKVYYETAHCLLASHICTN